MAEAYLGLGSNLGDKAAMLDAAVAAAYGWEWPLPDESVLERLLALNLERAAQQRATPAVATEVAVSAAE